MGLVKYLVALLLILIPATSLAATHSASSCKIADVTAAITAATSGDIVTIPTCEGTDGTWTSGITVTKNITIQGAGPTNTVITHADSLCPIKIGQNGGDITGMRITQIGFDMVLTSSRSKLYSINVRGTGWRIDHNKFTNSTGTSNLSILANGTNVDTPPKGLIDNNEFVEGRIDVDGMGSFLKSSTLWASAAVLGTSNAVYIEDNTFYKTVSYGGNVIDSSRASSYVARYNTVTGRTEFMAHGWQDEDERGTKNWEIYGNTFTASPSVFAAVWMRAGTGMIFNNTYSGYGNDIIFDDNRAAGLCGDCDVVGLCNGSSYADGNTNPNPASGTVNGWPCRDQIGRGIDASIWDAKTTNPSPAQALSPAYLWSNRRGAGASSVLIHNNGGTYIVADRDYYTHNASFNGTSGVGCGTLANRPATCTTGTAYWATDQSCTDMTGMVGKAPSTPISGSLYKCVDNAWEETASYTPYTYPHPLRGETGDVTAPTLVSATINAAGTSLYLVFTEPVTVNTNTGFVLTATGSPTLTYASGTGTATLIYTIGAAVQQSESGITLAYTTGANYIEDAAGNDLGSFTGTAVVNNSTQNTPPTVELTVTKTGSGCTVTSAPSGVNCGSTCTLSVDSGTVVTLSGWSENGWNAITYGGDCAANGTVTMSEARTCTATCTQVQLFP
jgi:hypothetical protein